MAEPAKAAQAAEAQEKDAGEGSSQDATGSECPFCVMMRKGGCEAPFKAFMDCGEKVDKSEGKDMGACLPLYEALHACMDKNKEVFDSLLEEMKAEADARDAAREAARGGEAGASGGGEAGGAAGGGGGGEAAGGGGREEGRAAAREALESAAARHHHSGEAQQQKPAS